MTKRVLISDKMSPLAADIFKKAGIEADVKTGLSRDELKSIIGNYDGLAARSATKMDASIIEAGDRLKVIGRAGMGVDNIDVQAATAKGVVVMNTPGGNSVAAAELAVAHMMALARHIPQANGSMKAGKWEKSRFVGVELNRKVLGIIGLGNIGRIVAERALGLKMRVIGYDPFVSDEKATQLGIELVDLKELFGRSDFITIHVPKTEDTAGLVNKAAIAAMKDGVRIINTSRGEVIDEEALFEALRSGKVAGAALDVFSKEPPDDNPLVSLPNVICTPHLGASAREAQESVAAAVAQQMADFLNTGVIVNAVNAPSVSGELLKTIGPYLTLAERLGAFHGQLIRSAIESVEIKYSGHTLDYDTEPLTLSLLKGLFTPSQERVNYVNARQVAENLGVAVKTTHSRDPEDFVSLIELVTRTKRETRSVAGTLFGKSEPRIVNIDGVHLDATPSGWILFVRNYDRPGTIGAVGVLLGKHKVNINRLQLGLPHKGGDVAISFVNIDSSVSEQALDELGKLENILSVKQVKFDV